MRGQRKTFSKWDSMASPVTDGENKSPNGSRDDAVWWREKKPSGCFVCTIISLSLKLFAGLGVMKIDVEAIMYIRGIPCAKKYSGYFSFVSSYFNCITYLPSPLSPMSVVCMSWALSLLLWLSSLKYFVIGFGGGDDPTGTMRQNDFLRHDADRHFLKTLNVAIPTASTDKKNMLSC